MKAAQMNQYGGAKVIEIHDIKVPSPKKGQVLVDVYAASLNPFDRKLRAGYMKNSIPLQFPVTLGSNFSGVVKALGEGVVDFKVRDEVYGDAIILSGGSGAFAQVLTANVSKIANKPKTITHIEAASLPLVGSSAIQALKEHIKLVSGNKILIHGGSGGIGSISIQLAKHLDAHVATTVSSENREFAKQLGADEAIDYETQKFEHLLKDFDAVYDTVGGETTNRSFKVLRKGGIIVSMLGQPNPELAKEYGVIAIGQNTKTNNQHLTRLAELVDSGAIKPQVDRVFPLEQTKAAFEYFEKAHPRGKVVLKVK